MTRWRANVAMVMWIILFTLTTLTARIPYVAPLSFVVVALIAWDYGFRPALAWIVLVHVLAPVGLVLLEIGPFFVFVESRELVAMVMAVTLCTVVGLAYLTDKVHSLTTKLQDSQATLVQVNEQLQAALNEVKELRGLLPICAWCKDIRDEGGAWEAMETYIGRHSRATFTHGLCPKCLDEQMQTLK